MKALIHLLPLMLLCVACDSTPPKKSDGRRDGEPTPTTSAMSTPTVSAPKAESAAGEPALDDSAAVIGRKRPGRVK